MLYIGKAKNDEVASYGLKFVQANQAQAFETHALSIPNSAVALVWEGYKTSRFGNEYYNEMMNHLAPGNSSSYWSYFLGEHHIYACPPQCGPVERRRGSARIGIEQRSLVLIEQNRYGLNYNYITENGDSVVLYDYSSDSIKYRLRGDKRYELSNHLGNVLAVITDRRIQSCGMGEVMFYSAQVVSVSDYYPFGQEILQRTYSGVFYRFGFNGMEGDSEVKGSGNSIVYQYRIYDPRLGRFLSVDPLFRSYPYYTPYQFAANQPIHAVDLEGLESSSDNNPVTHTVSSGETLWDVAKEHYKANGYNGKSFEQYWYDVYEWNKGGDYTKVGGTMFLSNPGSSAGSNSDQQTEIVSFGPLDPSKFAPGEFERYKEIIQKTFGYVAIGVGAADYLYFSYPYYTTPGGVTRHVTELASWNGKVMGKLPGFTYVEDWGSQVHRNTSASLRYRQIFGTQVKNLGRGLGYAGILFTVVDGVVQEYNGTATAGTRIMTGADVVIGYICLETGPAGWIVGGIYFLATSGDRPNVALDPTSRATIDSIINTQRDNTTYVQPINSTNNSSGGN